VQEHLRRMKELTDRLASIDAAVTEEDQMVYLLSSLPKGYSMLVTALETREGLSLQDVQRALVGEELKRGQAGEASGADFSGHDVALPTTKRNGRQVQTPRTAVKCYGCGNFGHIKRFCPLKSAELKNVHSRPVKYRAKSAKHQDLNYDSDEGTDAFVASMHMSSGVTSASRWVIDSGATRHMTFQKELLSDYCQFKSPEAVGLGDGHTVDAYGAGRVKVSMLLGRSSSFDTAMSSVLYVPQLSCNLFSVRAATLKGNVIQFGHSRCWIRDSNGQLVGKGRLVDKMYQLDCVPEGPCENASIAKMQNVDADEWHQRFGHVGVGSMRQMVANRLVDGLDLPSDIELSFCESCIEGKMHRKPHKSVGEIQSTERLQLIHSDVCGPMQTQSVGGNRYFVTFIDDYSRYTVVYFIKKKSEVFEKFKEFEALVTNHFGCKIKTLRSDGGGEYTSAVFEQYLKINGIRHELTVAHSPEQNGVAERMNRTLVESARAMLAHANLSKMYWAEAVNTAAFLRNRVPTTAFRVPETPYYQWYGKKPDVSFLRIFGCAAYTHVPHCERQKLDKKAVKLRFVSYSENRKGYRLLDENTHKVVIRYDVIFNKDDFTQSRRTNEQETDENQLFQFESESNSEELVGVQNQEKDQSQPVIQRAQRERRAPVRFGYDEFADLASQQPHHFTYCAAEIAEPSTIDEALQSEYAKEWKTAADLEYASLMKNDTWDLVELPEGRRKIDCKWVFKVKHDNEGRVERFKGRLVAKGYSQKYGIDYGETFSPVVRFSALRTLLAYAVQKEMLVHQMDVVTAFLHGELNEEIYMQQPPGYVQPGNEQLVCKLKKSLYGLKQSSRCWNMTLRQYLK